MAAARIFLDVFLILFAGDSMLPRRIVGEKA